MQTSPLASAECFVSWRSADASHRDWRFFPRINFWRDLLPADLGERMMEQNGARHAVDVPVLEGVADGKEKICRLRRASVEETFRRRRLQGPFQGRFYPRGVLADVSGAGTVFNEDRQPFRVLRVDPEHVTADLGHPLGGYSLLVGGRILDRRKIKEERGGGCNDILADLAQTGPGMQCLPREGGVDFDQADRFEREDPSPDDKFYVRPRLVHHIDGQARKFVNSVYRRYIGPADKVLDLMSSWASHLDGIAPQPKVTGLGLNREELAANTALADFCVHDLNRAPQLPWRNAAFDVAICTVSIEYLLNPYDVFTEVARVLRPGGRFIVTFSDRWFPPKVIRLWTRLHPFERMGLVLDYFRRSGEFTDLGTESWVGWPRPEDDKYAPALVNSDPMFAVWGEKKAAGGPT